MKIEDFFNRHFVFRVEEFQQFMRSREKASTVRNTRMVLYHYCQRGKLLHVRRGLYVVVTKQVYRSNTVPPFLIAGKATKDAVLAYHTALESHGLAYTQFNEHLYLTMSRTSNFSFQNQANTVLT